MLRKIEAEALEEDIVSRNELPDIEQGDTEELSFAEEVNSENEITWNSNNAREYHRDIKSTDKYSCEKCMLSFSNKMKYQKHLKTHDITKQLKCEKCPQVFSKQLHLKVHLRSHIKKEDREFICSLCGEQFIFEYLLKQHSYKHTDKKPFPCKKCGKGKI